jgi:hypothetical protein
MGANTKAFDDENKAFAALEKKLGKTHPAFAKPMGADAGFPDFGFTIAIDDKTKVDVHIEYKNSHTAQMGSMRDWRFDGSKFYTPDVKSEAKQELITLMNNTPEAVQNGKRLLRDFKKYFHAKVTEIYSGMLSIVPDKFARRPLTESFADNTQNYNIANISSNSLGNKIITHYKAKFVKNIRSGSRKNVLAMMIDKEIWIVDFKNVTKDEIEKISTIFGAKKEFNKLNNLTAKLEVRIQPRGLNAPASNPKPTSIDVMASYRLQGKPSRGTKIL